MTGRRVAAILGCAVALVACGTSAPPVAVLPSPSTTALPTPSPRPSPAPTAIPTTPPPAPSQSASPSKSAPAVTGVPEWLAGAPVTRLPTTRRVVALTFDGGAGAQGAATIAATLMQAGVPATFFLTGQFVTSYPQVIAALKDHNFLVGNHTMAHPHLTKLASASVVDQLLDAQTRLTAATGVSPRPLFRFPYGEYDARTLRLVHGLEYGAVGWTIDTRGWQGRAAGTVDDVVDRVHAALRPGAIVLMHLGANPDDGTTYDAVALPRLIAMIRAAGYTFTDLLNW